MKKLEFIMKIDPCKSSFARLLGHIQVKTQNSSVFCKAYYNSLTGFEAVVQFRTKVTKF